MELKKIEMWKEQCGWDIEEAKAEMEEYRKKIERTLERNNDTEIAEFLPTYSQRFAEAHRKLTEAHQTLRKIELVMEEN